MASVPPSPATQPSSPSPSTPRTPRTPGFNTKSPTIKRILQESRELTLSPDPSLYATPLETNLFEWHFTIAGPPSTPYSNGIYHGRIILPSTYPLRPPSFRFLTPSGRFETNREICLSISGHHEESWQPAWGIRTALCAIRAFMAGEAKGQVGGLDMQEGARKRLAGESRGWRCQGCGGKSNEEILREVEEEARVSGETKREDIVPEELRLAYREDLGEKSDPSPDASSTAIPLSTDTAVSSASLLSPPAQQVSEHDHSVRTEASQPAPPLNRAFVDAKTPSNMAPSSSSRAMSIPRKAVPASRQPPNASAHNISVEEPPPVWIDKAITGLVLGLAVMILKKILL